MLPCDTQIGHARQTDTFMTFGSGPWLQSEAGADEAVQSHQADQDALINHWEEGDLPRGAFHFLCSADSG